MKKDSEVFWAICGDDKMALNANTVHAAKREVFGLRGDITIIQNRRILCRREKGCWRHINP